MITALERLTKEIEVATDLRSKACLMAKRATYLAREGKFSSAREIAQMLRSTYISSEFLELTCWLCLLDGIILFYELPESDSFDRFRRSYELSRIISTTEVGVLAAGWLAHIEFNRGNFSECCPLSAEALVRSNSNYSGGLSRIALTVAAYFHYCMNLEEATKWYRRAREQALRDGDRAAVGAVMHNFSALGISVYRFGILFVDSRQDYIIPLDPIIDSSRNYDFIINNQALVNLEPLNRFRLLVGKEKFKEAMDNLLVDADGLSQIGLRRYTAPVLADKLLCEVRLGIKLDDLATAIFEILEKINYTDHNDDLAIVYAVLAEIASLTEDVSAEKYHNELSRGFADEHMKALMKMQFDLKRLNITYMSWSKLYEDS